MHPTMTMRRRALLFMLLVPPLQGEYDKVLLGLHADAESLSRYSRYISLLFVPSLNGYAEHILMVPAGTGKIGITLFRASVEPGGSGVTKVRYERSGESFGEWAARALREVAAHSVEVREALRSQDQSVSESVTLDGTQYRLRVSFQDDAVEVQTRDTGIESLVFDRKLASWMAAERKRLQRPPR